MKDISIEEALVGAQLINLTEEYIDVEKNGTRYRINIIEYEGDCCGYNEITTNLFISDKNFKRNPIITKVTIEDENCGGNRVRLVFFGEDNNLGVLDTYSYSGSGWCYGACVTLVCDELNIHTILSTW